MSMYSSCVILSSFLDPSQPGFLSLARWGYLLAEKCNSLNTIGIYRQENKNIRDDTAKRIGRDDIKLKVNIYKALSYIFLHLMLIIARSSTTTQRLHSFKFTLVHKAVHSTAWLLSIV